MLLHLEPSQLQRRRGNRRQRRQGQPLNHNYNKVSACRIRTCGGLTESGLINLQKPRFFFLFFSPAPQRRCHFLSNRCAISAVALASRCRTRGKGNFMAGGFLVLRKKKKNKRSDLAKKKKSQEIGLSVSEWCLMVTDNGNFSQVKMELILLPFPLGEAERNYCPRQKNRFRVLRP